MFEKGYVFLIDGCYPTNFQMQMLRNRAELTEEAEFKFYVVYKKSREELKALLDLNFPAWRFEGAIIFEKVPTWYLTSCIHLIIDFHTDKQDFICRRCNKIIEFVSS